MQTFVIDPFVAVSGSSCNSCCCAAATVKPGETDKWQLMYSAWSTPIGGRGLTGAHSISISLTAAVAPGVNLPPVANPFLGLTAASTAFSGALSTVVTDPEAAPLTYAALPLYGPRHGVVAINVNGAFIYTPAPGYSGYEHFFYSVSDGTNLPVVGEVIIGVSPVLPLPALTVPTIALATKVISVNESSYSVNSPWQSVSFAVETSPQARAGDRYRMDVRQQASDCDGNSYWHVSCYDIIVQACR